MFTQALRALFITGLISRVKSQTSCAPLMQALLQQAEATNGYGSWDACCARTGTDCYLSRQAVAPGFEPCDVEHSARAGCNRLAQGTVCMIGGDTVISGSPCGASSIRACGSVIVRDGGVAVPLDSLANLGVTPASILTRGVLGSQLCCSTSACTFASPCTSLYNISACLTDGTNIICIPLDQPNDTTYAAQIVQDGHNCVVTSSAHSSSPPFSATTIDGSVPTTAVPSKDVRNNNTGGTAALVGGSVGGGVGFICIIILFILLCARRRGSRTMNIPSDEWSVDHQEAGRTSHIPTLPTPQNTSGYSPSFPNPIPGAQWKNAAVGTPPSFPGSSRHNHDLFRFPVANRQNPGHVYQDPRTSVISRPVFQPSSSPPPPPISRNPVLPPAAVDTEAMAARIAALENRIMELSGPSSGVQTGPGRRGEAVEAETDRLQDGRD
ncbi:hypothetical protein M413DRAFT_12572 [Hebeloma cylindrosporum]|uniref:Uncharacterized protein n=1 Tax=Hebeloma cylindrosporum TaxID=76867 RepID=A0A0C3BPT5_HEBCY|nr:hypothetical protein M413DRAFT_12572 [Hebeloma cylindrosporum h7]